VRGVVREREEHRHRHAGKDHAQALDDPPGRDDRCGGACAEEQVVGERERNADWRRRTRRVG
jgi:hypothetical protein